MESAVHGAVNPLPNPKYWRKTNSWQIKIGTGTIRRIRSLCVSLFLIIATREVM